MSTASENNRRAKAPSYDITEIDILRHILIWKHLPSGVSFENKSLQLILEAYDSEEDINALPSKLHIGTPAHKMAEDLVKEVLDRPIISVNKDGIVDMFNWYRLNKHIEEVRSQPTAFGSKITEALDFSPVKKEIAKEVSLFDQLEEFRNSEEEENEAYETFAFGLSELDQSVEFGRGQVCIVAARPGSGKTTLSMYFGLINALKGRRVMFMSFEMSKRQILKRLNNFMEAQKISKEKQADLDFIIKYGAPNDFQTFKTYIKNEVSVHQPDILIIDYIQLFNDSTNRNRYDVISQASKFFKNFAMQEDLGLITCSQVSRASAMTGIGMESLYGSSELEADADIIMSIERGEIGSGDEVLYNALISLIKNRDGEPKQQNVLINYASMNIIENTDLITFND